MLCHAVCLAPLPSLQSCVTNSMWHEHVLCTQCRAAYVSHQVLHMRLQLGNGRSSAEPSNVGGGCTTSKTSLLDTFFFVPVQSLGQWSGDAQVTVAGQWLEPGKYMLQLALDPARCQCEIGQHGSLPFDVSWRLQLLPTAEAKACPIVADDSKQKYSLVRNSAHSHTAPAGIASHLACSRYMHCDSDTCVFLLVVCSVCYRLKHTMPAVMSTVIPSLLYLVSTGHQES